MSEGTKNKTRRVVEEKKEVSGTKPSLRGVDLKHPKTRIIKFVGMSPCVIK
ncbi:hypothetical protein HanXRQr2_Chr04g0162451 [Helianthus annuus]|uniref:Uncharacterized protein n=1 Tax=Helianthus annuus TaxID=4232 RepID=A0A9K3J8Q2_HELAN|nr:hypothetical protein HanXRQr2_Chr04g0162451 [Helianthus annuus]